MRTLKPRVSANGRPRLSPAAGHCRRHRRGADVPAARGPGQHRPWRPHFLRETVGRVRYGGARGQLTVRADRGFYAHTVVAACREMDVRFSITIRQRASLRDLIEAIPEDDWTSHSLLDGRLSHWAWELIRQGDSRNALGSDRQGDFTRLPRSEGLSPKEALSGLKPDGGPLALAYGVPWMYSLY